MPSGLEGDSAGTGDVELDLHETEELSLEVLGDQNQLLNVIGHLHRDPIVLVKIMGVNRLFKD